MPMHKGLQEKLEFQIASVLKLKLQDMTAESLSLARVERMNWNTFVTFCNMLEKVETENKLSDTHANHFNIDKIGTQNK
jgi:hypothetical protein